MKRWGFYAGIAIVGLFVTACSEKNQIVGKWTDGQGNNQGQIEFLSDGTCLMQSKGVSPSCTWQVLDDGRIAMHESIYGSTFTFLGRLDGESLTIQAPDGTTMAPLHRLSQ